ncbi:sensor histidine kinase [Pseudoalteromonas denitrificans]|uniref:histidine kinase n=1 Tax=Pseudoalteromonas denitrificans DSM 6059 TaxID=1123010 RepID=A0A1I1QDQ7_9GAMM|nr:ATP-binding protein [Pseudoalteromonas denitrificans]SFD20236.1 PAS fold [Pseudoalteromonas denitrificans DSM 6059]
MGFKRFSLLIVIRTVFAIATTIALTLTITQPGYHATSIVLLCVVLFQFIEIIKFTSKTNAELIRFFDAARHGDYSQNFDFKAVGTGFDELGAAFNDILSKMNSARVIQEEKLRHIKAIVEHVPVPLISIYHDGKVMLWNNSARRLFGLNKIVNLDDFKKFGGDFYKSLQNIVAGERRLINVNIDDMEHRLIISATEIIIAKRQETLLSMQDIQNELAVAQLQAWQDLVSVLTHEIMNSITPVASLAKTAVDLVEDVKLKTQNAPEITEELDDVLGAVQTVARRSDGLMQFVSSYRRLTRLPKPNKKPTNLVTLFEHVKSLTTQNWQENNITFHMNIKPTGLDLCVDVDMIEQILINLLQNAVQAVSHVYDAQIDMIAFLNSRGHVVIEVADNGEGIPDDIASQIFVPFFTTKKEGSGVGLALARQVMLAHEGKISVRDNEEGGATFSLTF